MGSYDGPRSHARTKDELKSFLNPNACDSPNHVAWRNWLKDRLSWCESSTLGANVDQKRITLYNRMSLAFYAGWLAGKANTPTTSGQGEGGKYEND